MSTCKTVAAVMVMVAPVALSAQQPAQPQPAAPGPGPRVTLIRSCEIAEGRGDEAMKWAIEVVNAARTATPKLPFESVRSYAELFGDLGRIHWIVEYQDFSALETFLSPPPEKLQAVTKQGAGLTRNCKDTLLRELGPQR